MIIDASTLDPAHAYKLLIGSIIPRAIGWISTISPSGIANLAPISFFTAVGRQPPMVSISLQPRADGVTLKDTFRNIRDTGEFVTNLVVLPQAHQMHRTAFEFPSEVDEFDAVGLEKAACEAVKVPRVKDAPISFECKLDRIIKMGDIGDHVVFGEVVRFHIRDDIYMAGGRIDTGALAAVGRLAAEYTLVESVFTTPLGPEVLDSLHGRRLKRLDGQAGDYSPIDTKEWSASGSTAR
jgi:flavin reductase (DIM6/NTAB) family NADH-FMN oxidoreductase RutF